MFSLQLVLEYMPQTIYRLTRHFSRQMQHIPMIYVRLYAYQVRFPSKCAR